MVDSVGIRMSVRGMMPAIMARRVSSETRRSTGPITKPMNRSMPVHSAPVMTWTKLRNHRLGDRIAAIITASAPAAATRYQGRSGEATGAAASDCWRQAALPRGRTPVRLAMAGGDAKGAVAARPAGRRTRPRATISGRRSPPAPTPAPCRPKPARWPAVRGND